MKRGDHKRFREARWKARVAEEETFARAHPVLSGRVKVEQYVEPKWRYTRPEAIRNPLDIGL